MVASARRPVLGGIMGESILSLAQGLARHVDTDGGDRPQTVYDWSVRYRKIEGRDFTLDQHKPLIPIYKDEHPTKVIVKPAQRGLSEYAINFACFALDCGAAAWAPHKLGLNVGYILPTMGALRDFSKERLSSMEDESPYLAEMFRSGRYQDVTFKQVRASSFLYLRGGWSKEGLKSFPADVMILDEYDEMNAGAIALADKRMNASPVKRKLELSTPILPGLGIHARFLLSDQNVYIQQCPNCRADNQYDFFRDVVVDGKRYDDWQYYGVETLSRADVALSCPKCEMLLDKAARTAEGIYVPQQPDVETLRGYQIPALAYPGVSLRELAMKAVDPNVSTFEEFMRQDLGVPYHTKGNGITEEMLVPLSLDLPNGQLPGGPWHRTTGGADIGARIHVKIASRRGDDPKPYVRYMGAVTSWEELDNLMERYSVGMMVVDAYPEQHAAQAFVARWKGRAVMGDYPTQMGALKGSLFAPQPKQAVQDGFVRINRTMALDAVLASVSALREHWPTAIINDPEVRSHMSAGARVTSINQQGQVVASWVRLRADHFLHASAYEMVARQLTPKVARPGRVLQATAKTQMPSGTNYVPPNGTR
jgi:hypothetical protein